MSKAPTRETEEPDGGPDGQVDAMKDQLRKDVASWSAARSGGSARASELSVATAEPPRQPSPPAAKRVRRTTAASADIKPAIQKKPFTMSYDGVTQADYITYMIARGSR
jgi:hypothetical protein